MENMFRWGNKKSNYSDVILEQLSVISENMKRIENKLSEAMLGIEDLRKRITTYVGQGVALTYLFDDTPIYINAHDFGPPANFINGGLYEQDNLDVLLSYVRHDTVFLDIGANLGFFSLLVGKRVRANGKVHAFEPNPEIAKLLRASAYLNGLSDFNGNEGVVVTHGFGVGNDNVEAEFAAPVDHAGGGSRVENAADFGGVKFRAPIRRLDDYFDGSFECDLVKIDIEGHEVDALRGMENIIARSNNIKIVFETLTSDNKIGKEIEAFLFLHGLNIYAILAGANLKKLAPGELALHQGYALATRQGAIENDYMRAKINVYPPQLSTNVLTLAYYAHDKLIAKGNFGEILFHGPYWGLRSGVYDIDIDGNIEGVVSFSLSTRFGNVVVSEEIIGNNPKLRFTVHRDLLAFECIARVASEEASVNISSIILRRIG